MLSAKNLFDYQSKFGVGEHIISTEVITYDMYLSNCRRYINDNTPREYHSWDSARKVAFTENTIVQFVNKNKKVVEGYMSEDSILDIVKLIDDIKISILDFGILRQALDDDEVQEIQINDFKSIWVVKGGKTELYRDAKGNPVQFSSNDEAVALIERMTTNPNGTTKRMTEADPLFNARAARSGYRVSGVNNTVITPDAPPYDFPVTSYTIRKYSSKRLEFDDFVEFRTLTPEMAKLLRLFGYADTRLFCIGPTSSGKTTLLNSILWEAPQDLRIILIQNPTEMMIYDRDFNGVNQRNVLHWEAESGNETDDPTKPTVSNFISHSLRNTPDILVPGEARTPKEFAEIYRALLTGHRVLGTFHSDDGAGAMERMANEIASANGGSRSDYIQSVCNFVDVIVSQYKLNDGSRKVMEISEVTGGLDKTGRASVNKLFEFQVSGENIRDEEGNLKTVCGKFVQVGVLSERLKNKLFKAGIDRDEIKEYLDEQNIGRVLMEVR